MPRPRKQHHASFGSLTRLPSGRYRARYRAAVLVAAWSGLRGGELFALRRRDVDTITAPQPSAPLCSPDPSARPAAPTSPGTTCATPA
jgi:hypothetical protein